MALSQDHSQQARSSEQNRRNGTFMAIMLRKKSSLIWWFINLNLFFSHDKSSSSRFTLSSCLMLFSLLPFGPLEAGPPVEAWLVPGRGFAVLRVDELGSTHLPCGACVWQRQFNWMHPCYLSSMHSQCVNYVRTYVFLYGCMPCT